MSEAAMLRIMGVDPGLASLGVVVIEARPGRLHVLAADVLRTKKASKKALRDLRVSADDQRRIRVLWAGMHAIATTYRPDVLAVETYAPQPGRTGGDAWKAAVIYGLVLGLGLAHRCHVLPFLPSDLKRGLARKASASKQEVADVVLGRIDGLAGLLAAIPAGQHEHATDAAGHALLALEEMQSVRRMLGMEALP
jgi:Holliday junction resolvasome RuvABC endonuclease subunit